MVWTNEHTTAILSTKNIVGIICNGIAVDGISGSSVRVLFDYTAYLVYTAELEKLAEKIKNDSEGNIFVDADSEKLNWGIISIDYNPLKKPGIDTLSEAISAVCNFVESHYMPLYKK